jgi:hypothetical protein
MNYPLIEIHEHDTINTGVYKVWYSDNGKKMCCLLSENYVNSLLNMRQKEDFFMGKYIFTVNQYEFENVVIHGKERAGLGPIKRTQL